jgi:hypothetical protein
MATYTAKIYSKGAFLGGGTVDTASKTITSYSGTAPRVRRNVSIALTSGAKFGETYAARVVIDSGATITLNTACNFG